MDQNIVLAAGVAVFFGYKLVRKQQMKKQIPELLRLGGIIVDVRTREEFSMGGNQSSLNIPLNELEASISKLDPSKPIIVCCASGMRSASARSILMKKGFRNVVNAGPWTNTVL